MWKLIFTAGMLGLSDQTFFGQGCSSAPAPSNCTSNKNAWEIPKSPHALEKPQIIIETEQVYKNELQTDNEQPNTTDCTSIHGSISLRKRHFALAKNKVRVLNKVKNLQIDRSEIKILRVTLSTYLVLGISFTPTMVLVFNVSEGIHILKKFEFLVPLFPSLLPFIYIFSHRQLRQSLRSVASKVARACCSRCKGQVLRWCKGLFVMWSRMFSENIVCCRIPILHAVWCLK